MQQKKIVIPTEPERHELVRNAKSDSRLPKIDDKRNNSMKMLKRSQTYISKQSSGFLPPLNDAESNNQETLEDDLPD